MTIYAWPAAWVPNAFELRVLPNLRSFVGPYTPTVQVIDLLGERWQGRIDLAPTESQLEGGAREAFFDRLKGMAHQMQLYNFRRPVPLGTARGVITLGASAAQLANTVTLAGCTNTNLLLNSSFEIDGNADNLSDGWTLFVGGAGDGARTYTLSRAPTVGARHGTATQFVQNATMGNTNDTGIVLSPRPRVSPGVQYTLSAAIRASVGGKIYLNARVYNSGGGSLGDYPTSTVAVTGGLVDKSVTFTAPANAYEADITIRGTTLTGEYFEVDAVQLELGATASAYAGYVTLEAGDMLGINGQLVRVMAAAIGTDAGACPVEIQPRLRLAQSSGAAVAWYRPTCNAILKSGDSVATSWRPGFAEGCSFEFIEVP